MAFPLTLPSPLEPLGGCSTQQQLFIKRDDLIHPIISGNKARKLRHWIDQLALTAPTKLITMGGNRSNYLHALGFLSYYYKVPMTAYIRGHRPPVLAATLADLNRWRVDLQFVDKARFRCLRATPPALSAGEVWLPEGGSDVHALQSIIPALSELPWAPDFIFVPVGTGVTALSLAIASHLLGWPTKVIGVVVLKGAESITCDLQQLCKAANKPWPNNLVLEHGFCGRGFAKISATDRQYQAELETQYQIPLEPVYAVKTFQAMHQWLTNKVPAKAKVIYWHTGGLQGNPRS
ncbi:MAG: pyridoxal-phosphate dependent enzyme [Gammaproteobacteria bacterium]|nr:pyridoxal-phosphate dependent enzyme [Gammaproteobacteria bacterium]NVK87071.1 pyridoxal-phosphate dependent enzyme [Gammaproteobacteria bacterium]